MGNRHEARVWQKGTTERDRWVSYIKDDIAKKIMANPSYKPNAVVTDSYGDERQTGIVIESGTQEYYKTFQVLPETSIYAGDYVRWGRGIWLVHTCSTDDEIYKRGSLWECNWLMKWQNDNGDIIERWCFASSASKYNEGVEQDKVFTLGSDQCKVYMPVDDEVLAITKKKEMLFIIDNANAGQPRIYEAHNPSNVYSTFDVLKTDDGKIHGVTDWILKETTYTLTEEEKQLGVCKYRATQDEDEDVEESVITGEDELPLTKAKTYTLTDTTWEDGYEWVVACAFDVILNPDGNSASVRVNDSNAIGSYLQIQVVNGDDVIATKSVAIKSLYG